MTPRTLKQVTYGQTSGAGLISMTGGGSEATIALESEWQQWSQAHPKSGVVLATSRDMPSGVTVVVKKDTPEAVRRAVMQWLASPDNLVPNAGRVVSASNAAPYEYVAGLGLFTPNAPKGVTRVTARQAFELSQKGRAPGRRSYRARIQHQARARRRTDSVRRKKPEGARLRSEGRFVRRAVKARQVAAGGFLLQRRRMLEVVQGVQGRRRIGLYLRVLAARRNAGVDHRESADESVVDE